MNSEELLKSANIPKELWNKCYIKDGMIFSPRNDKNGNIIGIGEDVYKEWTKNQNNATQ